MAKKILVFSSLFLFLISSSFSAGDTFISIIYGYTPLNFSDFNTNAESLNSLFSYWYDKFSPYGMTEKSGEFGRLSNAHSFESEARFEIRNRFEIGLVFDYFTAQMTSESTVTSGDYSTYGNMDANLTILNPNLVLDRYYPLSRALILEIYAGVGYYYAKIPFAQYLHLDTPGSFSWVKTNANLSSHGLGVMTGIALEVRPIRFIGLLLGTRYRLVHMGELSGSGTIKDSNGGEASINSGILYYYNNRELAPEIDPLPMLLYAEEKPVGLDGLREARLNLNGWTFLVGLRFWF